jgi:hypothetical protein
MNKIEKPFLSIDLPDGSQFRFLSVDEIANWLSAEQRAFHWFFEGAQQTGGGVANLRSQFQNDLNNLNQALAPLRNAPDDVQIRQQFANVFTNVYSRSTSVRSDHAFARIGAEVSQKDGPVAGAAALGALLGLDCQINFQTIKGILAAFLKQSGIDPQSPSLVSKTIADLNSSAAADRVKSATEWDGITERAHSLLRATDQSFKEQTTKIEQDTTDTLSRMNESVAVSIQSIQNTEATYKEQMKLRAPVEYWEGQGQKAWGRFEAITAQPNCFYIIRERDLGGWIVPFDNDRSERI